MRGLVPILLIACADTTPPTDMAAPPVTLLATSAIAGARTTLGVAGVDPLGTATFLASVTGSTPGGGPCGGGGSLCLDLLPPTRLLGTTQADASGVATLRVRIPTTLAPLTRIWFQAVAESGGLTPSQVVTRWVDDADEDGVPLGVDCYDDNPRARPGQTTAFAVDRGDGSYDYDCDGAETRRHPTPATCECIWTFGGVPIPVQGFEDGWDGGVPDCGETSAWWTFCEYDQLQQTPIAVCIPLADPVGTSIQRTQRCR